MKIKNRLGKHTWLHRQLPFMAHLFELVAAIVIFAAGQNMWAVLAGASPDITPPSVPTGLSMSGRSAPEIDLTWNASTDDVGVTGYHVYRNGTLVGTPTTPGYDDAGLTPNTSYSYTVSAFDASQNESAQSSPLVVSTLADTSPPSVPTNLHQTGQTISSISIAWDASSDNVGVANYQIYRNGQLVKTQSGTSYTDTGLAVYTTYSYNITANDAANNGSNLSSTLVGGTAADTSPPSVPDNISETARTVSSISLGWSASTDNVGVTGYHVYRNGVLVGSPGGTSFTDTGLSVSSSYTYNVSAYDNAGNESLQSASFGAQSSDDVTPPTIPTALQTTSVRDTSISFSWTASSDDVGVVGYKVYRNGTLVGSPTGTSFTDTGLTPVTNYAYTVKAYDAANNTSAASTALNTQTAFDTTPPSVPTNLVATSQTDTSITLGWTASTDNVAVGGYDIYRGSTLITTTSGTSFTDSGLGVNSSYTYRIRAHDTSGNNSAQTSPLTTSTLPDLIPPTSPSNLASTSQTTTSIDLSWNSATDDVGVTAYNLYRNGVFVATTGSTTYHDAALHYNTSYSYSVTALDAALNESAASSPLIISTLPDTTAPSVSLDAPTNGQTIQLTVPISATASDDLDLNRVEFYIDSSLIYTITSAPFSFNWDSYTVHNGSHTITAKAIDASGNFSSQSSIVTVTNPPPALLGDLNGDHKVNIYDLSILLSHWGKPGAGDFNNNGKVDIFDLSVLLSKYGSDNSNYQ
jgi:chitodextrinase